MATFTVTNNGVGTLDCSVTGDIFFRVTITNNTTGVTVYDTSANPGGRGGYTVTDVSPQITAGNSYTCLFRNSSGGTVGTLPASAVPAYTMSASAVSSGPNAGVTWAVTNNNVASTYQGTDIYVNGALITTVSGYSGSSYPSNVGYSTSFTSQATVRISSNYTAGTVSVTDGAHSGTTGGAPPAAPNPITNLAGTDSGSSIALTWSTTGATGFAVYRDSSFVTNVGTASYTDNSPNARPTVYTIYAYNSNGNGTTYASGVSLGFQSGAAALSATAGLTTTGDRGVVGTVSMTATAGETSSGGVSKVGVAFLVSGTSLVTSGSSKQFATVALAGATTLTPVVIVTKFAAAVLAGTAGLSATGVPVKLGTVSQSSTTTLTTSAVISRVGSSTFAATTTMSIPVLVQTFASVTLGGATSFTVVAIDTSFGVVAFVAVTTETVAGVRTVLSSAALTAAAALAFVAIVSRIGIFPPDGVAAASNISGSYTDVDDSPDAPDANAMVGTGPVDVRYTFPTPTGTLMSGANRQKIRVLLRRTP